MREPKNNKQKLEKLYTLERAGLVKSKMDKQFKYREFDLNDEELEAIWADYLIQKKCDEIIAKPKNIYF